MQSMLLAKERRRKSEWRDINNSLRDVKRNLMSHDVEKQKFAVEYLHEKMSCASGVGQEILIEELVESDIICHLCEALTTSHGAIVMPIFICLAKFAQCEKFYTHNHALYAVESILRVSHFMAKKDSNQVENLSTAVQTLLIIFQGLARFEIQLDTVCKTDQLLEFLQNLNPQNLGCFELRLSAASILCVILKYYSPAIDNDRFSLIVTIFNNTISALVKMTEETTQDAQSYTLRAVKMICTISVAGTPFCMAGDYDYCDEYSMANNKSQVIVNKEHRSTLAKYIKRALMEVVIPHVKEMNLDSSNCKLYTRFVKCLNDLFQLENCDRYDLANNLVANDYLKIFSRMTMLPIENLRLVIFGLLSQILMTLSTVSLPIESWLGGSRQFQRLLFKGLSSLPLNLDEWIPLLGQSGNRADALLVLLYYDFLSSSSGYGLYLPMLITYVLSFPKSRHVPPLIMKALWFTFSISGVSHPNPWSIHTYGIAVTRLNNMLMKSDMQQCYTHHPAILYHTVHNTLISEKMQSQIVSLWLESGGDLKPLIDDNIELTSHCLLDLIRTGSSKVVDLAMKAIGEMKKNEEALKELANIAWGILPQILASHNAENGENVKSILQIASLSVPENMSSATLVRSSCLFMNIFTKRDTSFLLKTLVVKQAYMMLKLSIGKNDLRVLTMYLKELAMLKKLLASGFANDNAELSFVCFKCLSYMIYCQAQFSIKCKVGLEIGIEDLICQLSHASKRLGIMQLIHVLLDYKIDRPSITLRVNSANCDFAQNFRALYIQLHAIEAKSGPEARDMAYSCLSGMLKYCYDRKNKQILKDLSEQPWTQILIKMTIASKQISPKFVDFIVAWLSYRRDVNPSCQRNRNGTVSRNNERILRSDLFEETLDILCEFLDIINVNERNRAALSKLSDALMIYAGQIPEGVIKKLNQKYKVVIID